jgi:iron complex outermembrane receptor protein
MKNDWSVSLTNRYISEIEEQCTGLVSDFGYSDLCTTPTTNKIGAKLYTDVQVSWSPSASDDRWTIQGGIQNLFNTETPICFSCDLNSFDGTLHPISGSYLYGRVNFRL